METQEMPVVEEQMEDLNAVNEQLNEEYKQRQRAELRTPDGMKKFVAGKIGSFANKLMQDKRYSIPFVVSLIYILTTGLYYVFAELISYKTLFIVLLCIALVNKDRIRMFFIKFKMYIKYTKQKTVERFISVKNYIGHLLFRIKSVFNKRK